MSTAAAKERTAGDPKAVAPWGIEIDVYSNSDVIVQSIPGCRLRGAIRAGRTLPNGENPPDSWAVYGKLPQVPGMELHVNPAARSYTIVDPLHTDEDLRATLQRRMLGAGMIGSRTEIRGVPPTKGELDTDRMKTLVREMFRLVRDKMAVVIKGSLPDEEAIDRLPGRYLLNPGSTIPNGHPYYEDEWESWFRRRTDTER